MVIFQYCRKNWSIFLLEIAQHTFLFKSFNEFVNNIASVLVFWPGGMWHPSSLTLPTLKDEILTTGPPGKSLSVHF